MTTIVPGHRTKARRPRPAPREPAPDRAEVPDGRHAAGPGQQTERGEQSLRGSGPGHRGPAADRKVTGDD